MNNKTDKKRDKKIFFCPISIPQSTAGLFTFEGKFHTTIPQKTGNLKYEFTPNLWSKKFEIFIVLYSRGWKIVYLLLKYRPFYSVLVDSVSLSQEKGVYSQFLPLTFPWFLATK